MPYSYREVLADWDRARALGGETRSLPEYAAHLNELYGTQDYSEGLRDGAWTRASNRVSQYLEDSPLGELGGSIVGGVGQALLGTDFSQGYEVGRKLPRMLINTAPLYIPGAQAGLPFAAASLGTGALFAGDTYAESGSGKAAAISGLTGAALPGLSRAAGNIGARLAGGEAVEAGTIGGKFFPGGVFPTETAGAGRIAAGRFAGSQTAQIGLIQGSMAANAAVSGQEYDPLSPEFLLNQIPFTVMDVVHMAGAKTPPKAATIRATLDKPQPAATRPYVVPAASAESHANMEAAIEALNTAQTPEERSAATAAVITNALAPEAVQAAKQEVRTQIQPDLPVREEGVVPTTLSPELIPPVASVSPVEPAPTPVVPDYVVGEAAREKWLQDNPLPKAPVITPDEVVTAVDAGVPPATAMRLVNTLPKTGNLVLDMFQGPIQEDGGGNVVRLGNTDVAGGGWMNEARFQKTTQLPADLLPAMREAYPEAFREGEVNATALVKGLRERPMVEAKKFGGKSANTEIAKLTHELDTKFPGWEANPPLDNPEYVLLQDKIAELEGQGIAVGAPTDLTKYSFLGPKPESEMPGYVEGLVRVPTRAKENTEAWAKRYGLSMDDPRVKAHQEHSGDKLFSGPHFGSEDTNVLAFFRGYEETLPDGSKAFHVIEVQSDWGQDVRKKNDPKALRERAQQGAYAGVGLATTPDHPLLASYESLALRAAIQHAQEIGATKIFLPDGETAMMTEGHDKVGRFVVVNKDGTEWSRHSSREDAEKEIQYRPNKDELKVEERDPSQSGGMRLHYDVTLQDAARKLTGDEGVRVDLGTHKEADPSLGDFRVLDAEGNRIGQSYRTRETAEGIATRYPGSTVEAAKVPGSPVFRNPDGTPKTSITGKLYSLENISGGLSINDTLSFKEAVQKFKEAKLKEAKLRAQVKVQASTPEEVVEQLPDIEAAKATIAAEDAAGATPTQAVDSAVLAQTTGGIQKSKKEQAAARRTMKALVRTNEAVQGEQFRIELKAKADAGDVEAAQILSAIDKATLAPNVTREKFQEDVNVVIAQWKNSGKDMGELVGKLKKTILNASRPSSKTIEQYPGTKPFETKKEAEDEFNSDPKYEAEGYKVHSKNDGRKSPYFIGKRIYDPADSRIGTDQMVGNEGTKTLGEIEQAPILPPEKLHQSLMEAALEDARIYLDNIEGFADEVDLSPEEAATHLQRYIVLSEYTTEKGKFVDKNGLAELNRRLVEKGVTPIKDVTAATKAMFDATSLIFKARKGPDYPGLALGSTPPITPEDVTLHTEIGIDQGVSSVMEWIAKRKELGFFADMAKAYIAHTKVGQQPRIIKPGDADWRAETGWMFQHGKGLDPSIHLHHMPSADNVDPWALKILHEYTHHLTSSMMFQSDARGVEFRSELEKVLPILQKSKQLSPAIRKLVQRAVREGHYDKLVWNKWSFDDMFKDWQKDVPWAQLHTDIPVIYGLLNADELITQTMSSPEMVAFAMDTPIKNQQGGVLGLLSKVWNKLFGTGKVEHDNVMSLLMQKYDNYLTAGLLKNTWNGADFIHSRIMKAGTRPEALASRMISVDRMYARGTLEAGLTAFEREMEAGILPMSVVPSPVPESIRNSIKANDPGQTYASVFNLLESDVPIVEHLYNRLRQDFGIVKDLVGQVERGEIMGSVSPTAKAKLKLTETVLKQMEKGLTKQAKAMVRMRQLDNFGESGFNDMVAGTLVGKDLPAPPDLTGNEDVAQAVMGMRDVGEVRDAAARDAIEGKTMGWFKKTFGLTQYMKKLFKSAEDTINVPRDEAGEAQGRMTELNLAYGMRNGGYDSTLTDSNNRVASDELLTRRASNIHRYIQRMEAGGDLVSPWKWTDPFIVKQLEKLPPKDAQAIKDENMSHKGRHKVWTDIELPKAFTKYNRKATGTVIGAREVGMLPRNAEELSQKVYDALALTQNPATVVAGQESLRQLGTQMQPDTLVAAIQHANLLVESTNKFLEFIRQRPGYISEQRYDKFHVLMAKTDNTVDRTAFDTRTKALEWRNKKESQGWKQLDFIEKSDADAPAGITNEMYSKLQELDMQAYNATDQAMQGQNIDPLVRQKLLNETQRANQYKSSELAFRPTPGVTRTHAPGRENLNMLSNATEFYTRANNWLRHRLTRVGADLEMLHPEVQGNRELKQYLEQHIKNFLTPDNQTAKALVNATYYMRLAFNLPNTLFESLQSLTTGMQAMIAETGGVGDAFKMIAKAKADRLTHWKTGKWASEYQQEAMTRLKQEGYSGSLLWNETVDPDTSDVIHANAKRSGLAKAGIGVLNAARRWSTAFQRHNDDTMLLAALDLAKEKGMSFEDSIRFAKDIKERGNFTGGKAQRAVNLWSTKTRSVPQLMTALTTYTQGWFNQMATDFKVGFGKAPAGTTAQQRTGSRKAFLYGLAAQATLAGALGLPGVGQGLALLQQSTGVDLKGWVRAHLAEFFQEDLDNGGLFTNLALKGGIAGLTPIDPSGRGGISFPFIGVDPYKGFNIGSITGAVGASLQDFAQGSMAALTGDAVKFQKILPTMLKAPVQLIQGEGDIRDARGALIQKLSTAERVMTALGFPPSRVTNARDTAIAVANANEAAIRRKQALVDEIAVLARKGQVDQARQRLLQAKQDDPSLDLQSLVRSVAGRAEAQTFPYDYRRDLNPGVQLQGLATRTPSDNLARLQYRAQTEQLLGGRPHFSPSSISTATDLDALMDSNPYLGVSGARSALVKSRRGERPGSGLLLPAYLGQNQ